MAIHHDFINEELSQLRIRQVLLVEVEINLGAKIVLSFVGADTVHERMLDRLIKSHPEMWVEDKQLVQEIDGLGRAPRILILKINARLWLERLEVLDCLLVGDEALLSVAWRSQQGKDHLKLIARTDREPIFDRLIVLGIRVWGKREA